MAVRSFLDIHVDLLLLLLVAGCTWGDALQFTQETYLVSVNETTVRIPRPTTGFITVSCLQSNSSSIISYQLLNSEGFFTLDESTGELQAVADLDFETNTSHYMHAKCFSEQFQSAEAQINITILPVNEYRPTISTRTEQVTIFEGAPIGMVIISTLPGNWRVYNASDLDSGPHGNIYYSATMDNTTFGFNSTIGELYLDKNFDLDAEQMLFRREQIVITVCDSSPPTSDCLNLIVVVFLVGENDNAPEFSQSLFNVSFPETLSIGSTITDVECTDKDYIVGNLEGYDIVTVYPSHTPQRLFIISNTGQITTADFLDYEFTNEYQLQVRCFDSSFEDFANVTVVVGAANDNFPVFVESLLNVFISESAKPFTMIAQLLCIDIDELIGELSGYELLNAPENFVISNNGTITLASFVDYEEAPSYELEVRCFDSGMPMKDNIATVVVNITAVNEHSPQFKNSSSLNLFVFENVPKGTVIAKVECSDQDQFQGELAGYELTSVFPSQAPLQTFHVNNTGTIFNNMPLDYEIVRFYELQVRCFDSGFPIRDDFSAIQVNIIDVNDNSPDCSQIPALHIRLGTHNISITLNCTDKDFGLNNQLRYSLTSIVPLLKSGSILVDSNTGVITFSGTIIEIQNHTVFIMVSDLGSPTLSATVSFVLTVEGDVNKLPLWAITAVAIVGLIFVCCLLMCSMYCCYACVACGSERKYFSETSGDVSDDGFVIAHYPHDKVSLDSNLHQEIEENERDFVLHLRTDSFENSSINSVTPTTKSSVDTEDEEELIYTTTTEFILNPVAHRESIESLPEDTTAISLPDVSITVETLPDTWQPLLTSEMGWSKDRLITNEDNAIDKGEVNGM